MAWALVTPASRGVGFHLTRLLLQTTNLPIIATARKDAQGVRQRILEDLSDIDSDRLTVLELDVTKEDTIQRAAEDAKSQFPSSDHHLRLAFAIPGILYPEKSPQQLEHDQLTETFAVNTIGPLLLAKHFTPMLPTKCTELSDQEGVPDHAVWLTMSARVGSTTNNSLGGWYSYRASKAGVNSLTKSLDLFLKQRSGEKAMAVAYHPGTVKTGLSKEFWGSVKKEKLFSPEDAVGKMMATVRGVGIEGRGRCWDWKSEEILP